MCAPHLRPLDPIEINLHLTTILSCALENLDFPPKPIIDTKNDDEIIIEEETNANKEFDLSTLPNLDLNVDVSLDDSTQKFLFLVNAVVGSMALCLTEQDFLNSLSGMNLLNILMDHPQLRENEHLMRAIDIYLTISSKYVDDEDQSDLHCINGKTFKWLYKTLAPSLASPRAQTRLLVTHILSLFPLNLPPTVEGAEPSKGMFSIMYEKSLFIITHND